MRKLLVTIGLCIVFSLIASLSTAFIFMDFSMANPVNWSVRGRSFFVVNLAVLASLSYLFQDK